MLAQSTSLVNEVSAPAWIAYLNHLDRMKNKLVLFGLKISFVSRNLDYNVAKGYPCKFHCPCNF